MFANGITLDVPPGALSQEVAITAMALPTRTIDAPPGAILAVVQLKPDGLSFASAVTLTMPMPHALDGGSLNPSHLVFVSIPELPTPDDASTPDDATPGDDADFDAPASDDAGDESTDDAATEDASGGDGGYPYSDEGDLVPQAEVLPFKIVNGNHLQAKVWHFCDDVLTDPGDPAILAALPLKTIKQILLKTTTKFASVWTRGLSEQILEHYQSLGGGLVRIDAGTSEALTVTDPLGGYVLPTAARAVAQAAEAVSSQHAQIQVAYTWRSLAVQYLLSNTNPYATASVGGSYHGIGAAIDLVSTYTDHNLCEKLLADTPKQSEQLNAFVPIVGPALLAAGYNWYGTNPPKDQDLCHDPMHFEFPRPASHPLQQTICKSSLFCTAILAFQDLWNANNPCYTIPSSEFGNANGERTQYALANAPAGGFQPPAYPQPPMGVPDGGTLGAGCTLPNFLCCPTATTPVCQSASDPCPLICANNDPRPACCASGWSRFPTGINDYSGVSPPYTAYYGCYPSDSVMCLYQEQASEAVNYWICPSSSPICAFDYTNANGKNVTGGECCPSTDATTCNSQLAPPPAGGSEYVTLLGSDCVNATGALSCSETLPTLPTSTPYTTSCTVVADAGDVGTVFDCTP